MIEKIIEIQNIGHFVKYKFQGTREWNGHFKKVNIIYAPNGSGKTTLSTILKSLSQNNIELIKFKRTFGAEGAPKVKIKELGNNDIITVSDESWSKNSLKIEVFDINYIEDYLFAGSYVRKQNKTNLFKLLLGQKGLAYKTKMKPIITKEKRLIKLLKSKKGDFELQNELEECKKNLNNFITEFKEYSYPIYNNHISVVNKYLSKFTSYIELTSFSYFKGDGANGLFRIFPVFEVYNERVEFSPPDPGKGKGNARYSMSEGDKSTIALCFFLARLEIQGVDDKIIVFDDPLSSFDYSRRNATIFQLSKIANLSIQLILLTHDLNFANDFVDKCSYIDCLTLKIENDGNTSYLKYHDIKSEFLTSTQKDIEIINNYIKSGVSENNEKREVIRCIRPVLEGVFKSKYFDIIPNNIWLGDIIELIKKTSLGDRLYKLRNIIEDIIELNDYTKVFHHSSGDSRNLSIDSQELNRYIKLLMVTIDKI